MRCYEKWFSRLVDSNGDGRMVVDDLVGALQSCDSMIP